MEKVINKPNFKDLWKQAMAMAVGLKDQRTIAVLENHKATPEKICRKLGIVSNADISRMKSELVARPHR